MNTNTSDRYPADKEETSGVTFGLAGSLTLEAALVLSLFLFACTAFLMIFPAMQLELELRHAAEQTAEEASLFAAFDFSGSGRKALSSEWGKSAIRMAESGGRTLYVRERILQLAEEAQQNFTLVRSGKSGVMIWAEFPEEESEDIVIRWSYSLAFPFFSGISFPVSGQLCRRSWSGSLYQEASGEQSEQKEVVYIAENGTVCHRSRECTYLRLSVKRVRLEEIPSLRNQEGAKYYPCSRCISKGQALGSVYITEEGNRYHSDTACGGLQRTIQAMPADETSLPVCSRCGGSHDE